MQLWHPVLNNGIILASFNLLGTIPVLNEQLYSISSGLHKLLCNTFNKLIGILYGPVDLEGWDKTRIRNYGSAKGIKPLSFTIYLEIVLSIKSTNKKHGGFDVTVSLFSWGYPLTTAHA